MKAAAGRILGLLLLITSSLGLAACDAIYDDTKGWANRLEAHVLKAAQDLDTEQDTSAGQSGGARWQEDGWEAEGTEASRPGVVQQAAAGFMAHPKTPAVSSSDEEMAAASTATLAEDDQKASRKAAPPSFGKQSAAVVDPTGPSPVAPSPKQAPVPRLKPANDGLAPSQRNAQEKSKAGAPMVIHLSSLRSEKAAREEWQALQRTFPDQLSAMSPRFRRTEIANRGVFYRVLAGPLPSAQAARQICSALKAKKQYCQVMPEPPAA